MPIPVGSNFDFLGTNRIVGLPQAIADGQAVVYEQLQSAIQGLKWEDSRAASTGNVSLAAPGATMDGVTLVNGDKILLKNQTTQSQNGVYIWSGASTTLVRSPGSDSSAELTGEIVSVSEGTTNGGTQWRQTTANPVVGTSSIVYVSNQASAPAASDTVAGIIEIATQAEVNTGASALLAVTPQTLANSNYAHRAAAFTIGDGSNTVYTVTHNHNSEDVAVTVREATGQKRLTLVAWRPTGVNTVEVAFDGTAPASGAYRVLVTKEA